MNLGDPELEVIDPTPNVHSLFLHFDKTFFWSKLASRTAVRWSKRMYSCAGTCQYDCRAGFCDIALSEPLLKLRPRKNLVETLLHEMIHAFLFVTNKDKHDRDGHGPHFQSHMYRINNLAGINITIYHDFHDEVKLYQTHWWRCNGPCQNKRPYFGMVRRSANRAPGPTDFWWKDHQKHCGGTFIKVKEPTKASSKQLPKSSGDITKYITNINKTIVKDKNILHKPKNITMGVLKDVNNTSSTIGKTKNNINVHIQIVNTSKNQDKTLSPTLNNRKKTEDNTNRTQSVDVAEVVRNVWANKQLPGIDKSINTVINKNNDTFLTSNDNKRPIHKPEDVHLKSPPNKIRKIDDYFVKEAKRILKDVYDSDFEIKMSEKDNKMLPVKINFVDCPICTVKIKEDEINQHIDECLNIDTIKELGKETKIPVIIDNKVGSEELENMYKSPFTRKSKGDDHNNSRNRFKIENIDNFQDLNVKKTSDLADGLILPKEKKVKRPIDNQITKEKNLKKGLRRTGNYVEKETKNENIHLDESAKVILSPTNEVNLDTPSESPPQTCPCCNNKIAKPMEEHLDECLAFTEDSGASTSFANTIVIHDDDDVFDETIILNPTGTKFPCPCCLKMIEEDEINNHLDTCLAS